MVTYDVYAYIHTAYTMICCTVKLFNLRMQVCTCVPVDSEPEKKAECRVSYYAYCNLLVKFKEKLYGAHVNHLCAIH